MIVVAETLTEALIIRALECIEHRGEIFDCTMPIDSTSTVERGDPEEPRTERTETVNAIMVIHPYKYEGMWVFDDEKVGLVQEPFVSGADTVIDEMVAGDPGAEEGFTLLFSAFAFPGHDIMFEWRREEAGGNWYYSSDLEKEGWLCPALLKYFEKAPERIYAQFKRKGG